MKYRQILYKLFVLVITLVSCTYSVCVAGNICASNSELSKNHVKRVVLKKNMVLGVNVLTQEMLTKHGENTKFIIKYDYTLQDEIVIPDNCILVFKRGSLRSGFIDFNYCHIESKRKAFYNIRFSNLKSFNINHFDIPPDATEFLQDVVNSCSVVDLGNKTFNIKKVITVEGYVGGFSIRNGAINALEGFETHDGEELIPKGTMLYCYNINKGAIENIKLNGNRYSQRGLFLYFCKDFVVDKCEVHNFDGKDKAPSWGVRCQSCNNVNLTNSHIYDILAMPVGVVGRAIGSAKGVVYGHTYNSIIENNIIENVQSTKDGDALQIIAIPSVNGVPVPSREDLYKDVNVVVSNNVIKANDNSKRCIKIQAFGVKVTDNYIQKLFANTTNTVSIYGSNVVFSNNEIDSREYYAIGLGTSALSLHDVVISNNTIYHNSESDWSSCIYILGSDLKDCIIDSNTVYISNNLNYFCDLREGVDSLVVSNNKVYGGVHFFRVYITTDKATIANLQLKGNYYEGDKDLLNIREKSGIKTNYQSIIATDNMFVGLNDNAKMVDVINTPDVTRSIRLNNNKSNRIIGL